MATSVFAVRLVNLRSVNCYTDQNFKSQCSFRSSKSLYPGKKGVKKVTVQDVYQPSTLSFYVLTCVTRNLNRNPIEEEDSSEILENFFAAHS